jgi:hypothetical protein
MKQKITPDQANPKPPVLPLHKCQSTTEEVLQQKSANPALMKAIKDI